MRFRAVVLGAALLMLGAGAANAGSNYVGMTGGAGFPTGDYGDAAATGWNIGATGTHYVNEMWGFGADLCYHGWGGSEDANDAAELAFGPGSEFSFTALQATAHATMNFQSSGNVRPYAKFGLGMYNIGMKLESPSGDADDSQSKFGFNVGAGMNFLSSSNMRWGVAGSYHIIPAEDDFGTDLNFMQVGVNVMWGMGN